MRAPILALALLLTGCPTSGDDDDSAPDLDALAAERADRLRDWLAGEFNSEQQSIDDPAYFAVQVLACPIDAPDLGARALYVEQAVMDSLDAPYRQRVYTVHASDDDEVSASTTLYNLTDPDAAIGLCDEDSVATFTEDDVSPREGCGVSLTWDAEAETFEGGTVGEECESSINGATYATSETIIDAEGFTSWDRGYDANDEQVWGAEDGPYIFVRQ